MKIYLLAIFEPRVELYSHKYFAPQLSAENKVSFH